MAAAHPACADGAYVIPARVLLDGEGIALPNEWRYRPGDDPAFARPGLDDGDWATVDARLLAETMPPDWDGLGWFRLRLDVDPSLVAVPLALRVVHPGASEVYLDGERLIVNGTVGDAASTVPEHQRRGRIFAFDRAGEHLLAVRYANHRAAAVHRFFRRAGIRCELRPASLEIAQVTRRERRMHGNRGLFLGIFLSFALLHLLLFAFYRRAKQNLDLALLCVVAAAAVYLITEDSLTADPRFELILPRLMSLVVVLFGVFGLRFVYGALLPRPPRWLRPLMALAALLLIWGWWSPTTAQPWLSAFLFLACVELVRVVVTALVRGRPGARILGLGVVALAAGLVVGLMAQLGVVTSSFALGFRVPFYSLASLLVSMSVYLSYDVARTHRALAAQLERVRTLSEEKLREQERAHDEALERQRLEAEYARQVAELEEARQLQLSMLPAELPELPGYELAAHMTTATEVGGDYYDVAVDGEVLTVAVGDATGHGLRAGTMVTATKSLFGTFGRDPDLVATLSRASVALRRLGPSRLMMALALARFERGTMRLASAGMPPPWLYRAAAGEVESLTVAGAPLGSLPGYPYRETVVELAPGDVVLFASDGFPERRGVGGELLGFDRAREAFARCAREAPETIVERLLAAAEEWAAGEPADDDVTFFVVRARSA